MIHELGREETRPVQPGDENAVAFPQVQLEQVLINLAVNAADAMRLLNRYRVSYIYVGDLERTFYDPSGIAKFDVMRASGQLELVYENERVKIYRVKT